jgi:hypothetical protein
MSFQNFSWHWSKTFFFFLGVVFFMQQFGLILPQGGYFEIVVAGILAIMGTILRYRGSHRLGLEHVAKGG